MTDSMTHAATRLTIVYIYGTGHCGSTLLNFLLNAHSQMLGLSEIDYIDRHLQPESDFVFNPVELPFWKAVGERYEATTGRLFADLNIYIADKREIDDAYRQRWQEDNRALFQAIAEVSGVPLLVDASKRPWRLKLLAESGLFDLKVIYLLRDGRAVVNSYYKIYGDFADSFWRWLRIHLWWWLRLRRKFTPNQVLRVKYEALATDPADTLRQICDFLGVPYEETMLRYKEREYYGIGGNQKMLSKRDDQTIRLDEGWRETLPRRYQRLFALLGGWLNRTQGYGK